MRLALGAAETHGAAMHMLIGVVFVTGDAIAKSLHRMLRRAAKPGGRVRKPKPADASPAPVIGGGL